MARPKGPEQRVPVKMRVNIGLMDRLRQLAAENRYSVPKMLTVIMEETLADLPADYELHEMAEIYTLTKNHAVNLSSNRMNVYLLPGTQEAMLELAHRLNASIGAVRTSFVLDYLLFSAFLFFVPRTGISVVLANVAARFISAFYNYSMNCRFVFHTYRRFRTAAHYFALAGFLLIVNNAILTTFVQSFHMSVYPAKLLTEGVLFLLSWIVQKQMIFRKRDFPV